MCLETAMCHPKSVRKGFGTFEKRAPGQIEMRNWVVLRNNRKYVCYIENSLPVSLRNESSTLHGLCSKSCDLISAVTMFYIQINMWTLLAYKGSAISDNVSVIQLFVAEMTFRRKLENSKVLWTSNKIRLAFVKSNILIYFSPVIEQTSQQSFISMHFCFVREKTSW